MELMGAGSHSNKAVHIITQRLAGLSAGLGRAAAAVRALLSPAHFPIAYKLALIITLVITIGMSLLGAVVLDSQTRLLRQQMDQFGMALIRQMADTVKEPLLASDALNLRLGISTIGSHTGILGAAVYSDELRPLAQEGVAPPHSMLETLKHPASTTSTGVASQEWDLHEGRHATAAITFFAPIEVRELTAGYVLLTFDYSQLSRAQRDTLRAITTATVLMVLLGAIASVILGKRLSRPINELMDASLEISRGNYNFRFMERRNDEIGTLMQSFNTMTEGLLRKEQVEQVFSRYVAPKVAKELLSDLEQVHLGGQHVHASVLFADIAGFTALSEDMAPQAVNALLNEYFGVISRAAQAYHGHVDKYMGDCAMLVFGVPEPDEQHTLHAVCCAILIQRLIRAINDRRGARGEHPVHFHISCNSGVMLAGNMGSHDRMEYTVVGDAVNLAARLAAVAEAEQIIISRDMHDLPILAGHLSSHAHATIRLRGKAQPVSTYRVLDIDGPHRAYLEQQYEAILAETFGGAAA